MTAGLGTKQAYTVGTASFLGSAKPLTKASDRASAAMSNYVRGYTSKKSSRESSQGGVGREVTVRKYCRDQEEK